MTLYTFWGFAVNPRRIIQRPSTGRRRILSKEPLAANYTYRQYEGQRRFKSGNNNEMVYVEELDRSFKACCYQSARLGDSYCPCGKAVDQELIEYLKI
jgi:hypothetical protein